MKKKLTFLGIETSCDETAASVVQENGDGTAKILSNIVSSQIQEHKKFGGVVPELAARAHVDKIDFIIQEALNKSKTKIILNVLMLLSSMFIISSCDNDIDDVTCDECYENKIIGEWILNVENIYHSQECTNEMINMNGEVEYSDITVEFLENGEFTYTDNQNNQENIYKHDLSVRVEKSQCIACCSCETIAPNVFVIDKLTMINPKSQVHNMYGASEEKIMDAAETCPTKAIKVSERKSGRRIYPL